MMAGLEVNRNNICIVHSLSLLYNIKSPCELTILDVIFSLFKQLPALISYYYSRIILDFICQLLLTDLSRVKLCVDFEQALSCVLFLRKSTKIQSYLLFRHLSYN